MMQFAANPRLKLAIYLAAAILAVAVVYSVPSKQQVQAQPSGLSGAADFTGDLVHGTGHRAGLA